MIREIKDIDFDDIEVTKDNIRVTLEWIGEGYCGQYNPENPTDEPLIRFYVEKKSLIFDPTQINNLHTSCFLYGDWEDIEDASYCTQLSVFTAKDKLQKIAELILDRVYSDVVADRSIKKLCERLSWITAYDL